LRLFIRYVREPFVIAFATTSSAAALPQTLLNIERFGVPRRVLGVVAPLSLSLNLNGSTIYLGLGTLFVAQAAQVSLSLEQQLLILLTLKLTSNGIAGNRGNACRRREVPDASTDHGSCWSMNDRFSRPATDGAAAGAERCELRGCSTR
jgi:L-cystine uptake protein TcyP (sodium:dicarboxylate symporter family)